MQFMNWYSQLIRNPKYRWWIIGGSLIYLLSPIDILPDFIPVLGQVDDVAVMSLLVAELSQTLIRRVQAGKAKRDAQTTTASAASNPTTASSVDVNAVEVG